MVTSNHILLLVNLLVRHVIAQSTQLIAGRTAQEYNQRRGRQGAFWEDRYHATAIEVKIQGHVLDSGRLFEHDRQACGSLHGLGVESSF
jgi:Transposase IS200 like